MTAKHMRRPRVDQHLHDQRAAGVDGDILPAARARSEKRLMDLVEGSGHERKQHRDQRPFELPRITEERPPVSLQHRFQPVAMGVLQGQEHKRTQDGIADEVPALAYHFIQRQE